jgi:hypothetical protein
LDQRAFGNSLLWAGFHARDARLLPSINKLDLPNNGTAFALILPCAKISCDSTSLPIEPQNMVNAEPTPQMVAFFEKRTWEHIDRVRKCLSVMARATVYSDELYERSREHDASKFEREERVPYIWLTEFHRCRHCGLPFLYPDGMEERVRAAVNHHVTTNRHHPEFHSDVNKMTDVDLIEMVCDWTAMSQEFEQDGGSARGWADKTIGKRLQFNDQRRDFVYRMINLLDANFDV